MDDIDEERFLHNNISKDELKLIEESGPRDATMDKHSIGFQLVKLAQDIWMILI